MDVTAELLSRIENYSRPLFTEEIVLKRNELLHSAGTVNTKVYFVTEGSLRIFHQNDSEFNTIRFGYSGSLFASLDSFFSGKPSVYAVQAIKLCRLKVMKKADFMEFIESNYQNLLLWNSVLSYTINTLLERELDLLITSPFERYERVRQRSPRLFQEIPHKYIASYLRMAPETLSRLQKNVDLNQ